MAAIPVTDDDLPDRLSVLPDDVLHQILSQISMKQKARTSVLSKRWRDLWPSNPSLNFSCLNVVHNKDHIAVVDRCLRLPTTKLRSLSLDLSSIDPRDPSLLPLLAEWIHCAAERSVSQVILDMPNGWDGDLAVPLSQCRSLSDLRLSCCSFLVPPSGFSPPGSPSLPFCSNIKTLHLTGVQILDEDLRLLIIGCTLVEDMMLDGLCGPKLLEITSRQSRLELLVVSGFLTTCRVVIEDAPNLRSFMFDGNLSLLVVKKAPRLSRIQLDCDPLDSGSVSEFMADLLPDDLSLEFLSLNRPLLYSPRWPDYFILQMSGGFKRFPVSSVCNSLKELHLCYCSLDQSKLCEVLKSLQHIPSLEILCLSLNQGGYCDDDEVIKCKMLPPPYQDLCHVMHRLKTVTLVEFTGGVYQLQFVRFVLRFSLVLESLSLNVKQGVNIDEKLRLRILQIPKASRNARVVLSKSPEVVFGGCPRQLRLWASLYGLEIASEVEI